MKVKSVPSSWMGLNGRRLDCGPYMSGALESKIRLEKMSCKKERLADLCSGGEAGLVNAGRISRLWVADSAFGFPFLTSRSILQLDLSDLRFISKRTVLQNPKLLIRSGYTLVTRAGTVGRMSYARPEMEGMACSEDVLRVIPDDGRVPPGYLFAFLSSKFGVPLVTSGTYGAIIQHIEPQHIADLPVPRLGDEVEGRAHDLVVSAAAARTEAVRLKTLARALMLKQLRLENISASDTPTSFSTFVVASARLRRLDAAFHSPACSSASQRLAQAAPHARALADIGRVFTPGIFKRRYVEDTKHGYPYFSGTELFQIDAVPRGYLARNWPGIEEYRVEKDWLLIQDAGQLGGLIGNVVRVPPSVSGGVVSNHLMRVAIEERESAAFVFTVLTSAYGYRAIVRNAFGSSIPQLDSKHVGAVQLPWPDKRVRTASAKPVLQAWQLD